MRSPLCGCYRTDKRKGVIVALVEIDNAHVVPFHEPKVRNKSEVLSNLTQITNSDFVAYAGEHVGIYDIDNLLYSPLGHVRAM